MGPHWLQSLVILWVLNMVGSIYSKIISFIFDSVWNSESDGISKALRRKIGRKPEDISTAVRKRKEFNNSFDGS